MMYVMATLVMSQLYENEIEPAFQYSYPLISLIAGIQTK